MYNFGELLAHKVLDSLKGTENAWLTDLLFVFNSGDVNKFRTMKPKWSSIPDLASHETRLYEKVCLLCLMEMAFRKEATERHIAFAEIAKETTLPLEQVELLVMKGLSQGLVRGKIDEVEQVVMLTWVQPRVLDKQQLNTMTNKIQSWCTSVQNMELRIESKAGESLKGKVALAVVPEYAGFKSVGLHSQRLPKAVTGINFGESSTSKIMKSLKSIVYLFLFVSLFVCY